MYNFISANYFFHSLAAYEVHCHFYTLAPKSVYTQLVAPIHQIGWIGEGYCAYFFITYKAILLQWVKKLKQT